jgi:predicted HTH transcriptional regulator
VLALLRENPKITANQIAEITLLSLQTIRNIQAKLKNSGIIERQGSDKDGEWIINARNDFAL